MLDVHVFIFSPWIFHLFFCIFPVRRSFLFQALAVQDDIAKLHEARVCEVEAGQEWKPWTMDFDGIYTDRMG